MNIYRKDLSVQIFQTSDSLKYIKKSQLIKYNMHLPIDIMLQHKGNGQIFPNQWFTTKGYQPIDMFGRV